MSKVILLIIILGFFLLIPSVLAETNDAIIDINSTNVDVGDSIILEVWVEGNEMFDSWFTNLDFNSYVSFVECEVGDFWTGSMFYDNGTLDGTSLNNIQAFSMEVVTTPVLLFTAEFVAVSNGYCNFILEDFQIFYEGPEVPISVQSVRVKIGSGGSSGGGGGIEEPEDDEPIAVILTTPIKFKYYIDEKITFDASGSSDDYGIVSYVWEIENKIITNETFEHQFKNVGNYTVTLTVEDTYGQKDTISEVIKVIAEPEEEEEPVNDDDDDDSSGENGEEEEEQEEEGITDEFDINPQAIIIIAFVIILVVFIVLHYLGKI